MLSSRATASPAAVAVLTTAAVAAWGFSVDPDPPLRWLLLAGVVPALWAYVEVFQVRGADPEVGATLMALHRYNVMFLGLMLASMVAVKLAVHQSVLDASWLSKEPHLRGFLVGGWMVVFGNLLPTLRSPWPYEGQPFAWQQVHRFAGWVFVAGGLCVIASWMFLTPESAKRMAIATWMVVFVLVVGRKFTSLATHSLPTHEPVERAAPRPPEAR